MARAFRDGIGLALSEGRLFSFLAAESLRWQSAVTWLRLARRGLVEALVCTFDDLLAADMMPGRLVLSPELMALLCLLNLMVPTFCQEAYSKPL